MHELPLGISNFKDLRDGGYVYVDKSAMIYELAKLKSKIFLSRPRRFGKSLLVDTFETLFTSGTKYFKGLAIEALWNDKTYPVIHLDFGSGSNVSTVEDFRINFRAKLETAFMVAGVTFDSDRSLPVHEVFSRSLKNTKEGPVLLIDEYDAPLNHCLDNPKLFNEIREELSNFYGAVKANDVWRFVFITGIAKFSKTSIFSALNNLKDISLDPKYGTLLGYSEEEIEQNFAEHLAVAEKELNLTHEELIKNLRDNYDGFCFEETARKHVYAPWSTLNFMDSPELGFKNYWYSSGGQPTVLVKYFGGNRIDLLRETAVTRTVTNESIVESSDLENMKAETLLYQTGYLTLKGAEDGAFELGFPNAEVRTSMMRFYTKMLVNGTDLVALNANKIYSHLRQCNFNEFVACANRALIGIDYVNYPLRDEASVRAAVQMMVCGAGLTALPEVHNALGRSDLEFDLGENHWVLEFKYAQNEKEAETKLTKALNQIAERQYGEASGKKLMRYALVFTAEKKQITHFSKKE